MNDTQEVTKPVNDEWDEELNLEDSQVATDTASACHIGDPECESCQ